jgi:hypothetical protein
VYVQNGILTSQGTRSDTITNKPAILPYCCSLRKREFIVEPLLRVICKVEFAAQLMCHMSEVQTRIRSYVQLDVAVEEQLANDLIGETASIGCRLQMPTASELGDGVIFEQENLIPFVLLCLTGHLAFSCLSFMYRTLAAARPLTRSRT